MRCGYLLAIAAAVLAGCAAPNPTGSVAPITSADPVASTRADPAAAPPGGVVRGSGRIVREARDIRDVTGVELSAVGELIIEQTGTESLTIDAADNVLPLLGSDVSGGVLRLGPIAPADIVDSGPITYRLTVRSLESLVVSGAADVTAADLQGGMLSVAISGAADVTVGGAVDRQDVEIGGAGEYDGENLRSTTARVIVDGAGSAVVSVSDRLDATVSGVGSIEYLGDPVVTSDVSGVGSVSAR